MSQDIAVILIGILTIGYIGLKTYRFLTRPDASNPCAGCPGCPMKDEKTTDAVCSTTQKPGKEP